jgi:pimeloyl-ACP methyl ester carboxylesterase
MAPAIPELDGTQHTFHELPTGVRVHLAAAGPADAPPVLALHGWPQHWWAWRAVIARLAGELRVLCPDLRGFGWSSWPADGDFTKERLADDALALLDVLGIERTTLAGHDWGGYAAILAALRAPERFTGLLFCSIGHPWQPPRVALRNAWRLIYQPPLATPLLGRALVRDGRFVRFVLERARRDDAGWRPGEVDAYVDVLREPQAARASELLYRHFLVREVPPAAAGGFRGRRLTMPARLLHGRRDPLGTDFARGLERHADDGTVELVDGAGHFLPEEAPTLVAERIRALAARSRGRPARLL